MRDVLLTPVPLEHLVDGAEVCRRQGSVAFGSNAWEVMRDIPAGTLVLIYESCTGEPFQPIVSWRATFGRCVEAGGAVSLRKIRYLRPPSTDGEETGWAGYYIVRHLNRLQDPLPFGVLRKLDGSRFAPNFVPLGPIMAGLPNGSLQESETPN